MNYQSLLAAATRRTVRAGLVGVGQFGQSLIGQARSTPGFDVPALCDRDVDRAVAALRGAGFADDQVQVCDARPAAERALEAGRRVVTADAGVLVDLPVDIVVEATGSPDAGAANAAAAIEAGRHVAMVTKEADSVVGPLLHARAREAGLVYTAVDGDQPSLLMGLVSWARALGLEIVCAGKSSEYDFVFDPFEQTVTWRNRVLHDPDFEELWTLPGDDVAGALRARAERLASMPQRTVPDLCEMALVANATGLGPDTPSFHVPVARAVEIPDVLCPRTSGGLLASEGVIDVFNCLRRVDEASFAGGVFVVVRCTDRATWEVLKEKGHPVSRAGEYAMLYNPQHLLGVEAPISMLAAALLGQSSGDPEPRMRFDVTARAERDLEKGAALAVTDPHHHEVAGIAPALLPARPLADGNPLPYYLAAGRRLARDVARGEPITRDAIEPPEDSPLWRLRTELDRRLLSR